MAVNNQVSQAKDGQDKLPAPKPGDASREAIAALLAKIDAVLKDTEPALLSNAGS